MVRYVVLGDAVLICGVEDYCVEVYSVGGCGVKGCRVGIFYVEGYCGEVCGIKDSDVRLRC